MHDFLHAGPGFRLVCAIFRKHTAGKKKEKKIYQKHYIAGSILFKELNFRLFTLLPLSCAAADIVGKIFPAIVSRGCAMKLSAKTRYAARILLYLAKYGSEKPVSSSLLAAQTGISSQFIEQILRQLRLAGLTGSIRGARGGHMLLRKPEELTFGNIVKLMEGGIELTGCLENPLHCNRFDNCEVRQAWKSLQSTLDCVFDSISLRDLMKDDRMLR